MRTEANNIPQRESFIYLGSIIRKDREIEEDAKHRIRARWIKWRLAFEVPSDRRIPKRLKEKAIRPAMTYEQNAGRLGNITSKKMCSKDGCVVKLGKTK